jgi:hypothetical protein
VMFQDIADTRTPGNGVRVFFISWLDSSFVDLLRIRLGLFLECR